MLLALPLNVGRDLSPRTAAAGHFGGRKTIDGEYHRLP